MVQLIVKGRVYRVRVRDAFIHYTQMFFKVLASCRFLAMQIALNAHKLSQPKGGGGRGRYAVFVCLHSMTEMDRKIIFIK